MAQTSVTLRNIDTSQWTYQNGENRQNQNRVLTGDNARDAFQSFEDMVKNAKVLEGNVILRSGKLVRVSYGSFRNLAWNKSTKGHTATREENLSVRAFFESTLKAYITNELPGAGALEKARLERIIDKCLGESNAEKPLSRRTISQLVGLVRSVQEHKSASRPLDGSWKSTPWKLVGGLDLGVAMSRKQVETMFKEGMAEAKKILAEKYTKADVKGWLTQNLTRLQERYLKMFEGEGTGGDLEAIAMTGMDPKSIAEEMIAQLEGKLVFEKAESKAGGQAATFGPDGLRRQIRAIREQERKIGTLAMEESTGIGAYQDAERERLKKADDDNGVSQQTRQERNFIADLLLNGNVEKALAYGTDGERIVALLSEDTDILTSLLLAARNQDPQAPRHALEDENGNISAARGRRILDSLAAVAPEFKASLEALLKDIGANTVGLGDCKTKLQVRCALFAKLDEVFAKFAGADLETKINTDLRKNVEAYAKAATDAIKEVCEGVRELDMKVIRELAVKSNDYDLRRLFASGLRNCSGNGLPMDKSDCVGGFIRGMGVYANKLIQGLKLKDVTTVQNTYDDLPTRMAAYRAVKDARGDLPPIDPTVIRAQLYDEYTKNYKGEAGQIAGVKVTGGAGAGSVAQTFFCEVHRLNANGQLTKEDVVVKMLRPDIREEFNRQAKIVQDLIKNSSQPESAGGKDLLSKDEVGDLKDQLSQRQLEFGDECNLRKELVNALFGTKILGQGLSPVDGTLPKVSREWVRPDGEKVTMSDETGYVGSESLVLKDEYSSMVDPDRTRIGNQITQAINAADSDAKMEEVLDKYFEARKPAEGGGNCMLINCAKGEDLAKFQAGLAKDEKNGFGVNLDGAQKPEDYTTPIKTYMDKRKTLEKLNRAILQLKESFLEGALFSPDRFFHCDLHASNLVFDEKSGALTVIDYGKAKRLSVEEADAMKLLLLLEGNPDGELNGELMAEAYLKLLDCEIKSRTEKQATLTDPEKALNAARLQELQADRDAITEHFGEDGLAFEFAESLERVRSGNKGRKLSAFDEFRLVLQNVKGKKLPLPATVLDFVDSYTRLQNAVADVQSSISGINQKIADAMKKYEESFVEKAIDELAGAHVETEGWLSVQVDPENSKKVTLEATTLKLEKPFGGKTFSELVIKQRDAVKNAKTPLARRMALNALKSVIEAEEIRIGKVTAGGFADEIGKTFGEDVTVSVQEGALKGCENALAMLKNAKEAISKELELLQQTVASDSLYATQLVDSRLLANGEIDPADTKFLRLPVTAEDRLQLDYLKATGGDQATLPDALEKKYCQVLVACGDNWVQLAEQITQPHHTVKDFENLLDRLQKGEKIASIGTRSRPARKAGDKDVKVKDVVNQLVDKDAFSRLYNLLRGNSTIIQNRIVLKGEAPGDGEDKIVIDADKPKVEDYNKLIGLIDVLDVDETSNPFKDVIDNTEWTFTPNKVATDGAGLITSFALMWGKNGDPDLADLEKTFFPKGQDGLDKQDDDKRALREVYEQLFTGEFSPENEQIYYNGEDGHRLGKMPQVLGNVLPEELEKKLVAFCDRHLEDGWFKPIRDYLESFDAFAKEYKEALDGYKYEFVGTENGKKFGPAKYNLRLLQAVEYLAGKYNTALGDLPRRQQKIYNGIMAELKESPFDFGLVHEEHPSYEDYREAIAAFRTLSISRFAKSTFSPELFKELGGTLGNGEVLTDEKAKLAFDAFLKNRGYDTRNGVGAYDIGDGGENPYGNVKDYNDLVDQANKNLFGPDNLAKKLDNPTNTDYRNLCKKVNGVLETQPRLTDNIAFVRNVFGRHVDYTGVAGVEKYKKDANLYSEKGKNTQEAESRRRRIRFDRHIRRRYTRKTDGKTWGEGVKEAGEGFNKDIGVILDNCKKESIAKALEVKENAETGDFSFVATGKEFGDLRKLICNGKSDDELLEECKKLAEKNQSLSSQYGDEKQMAQIGEAHPEDLDKKIMDCIEAGGIWKTTKVPPVRQNPEG